MSAYVTTVAGFTADFNAYVASGDWAQTEYAIADTAANIQLGIENEVLVGISRISLYNSSLASGTTGITQTDTSTTPITIEFADRENWAERFNNFTWRAPQTALQLATLVTAYQDDQDLTFPTNEVFNPATLPADSIILTDSTTNIYAFKDTLIANFFEIVDSIDLTDTNVADL